MTDTANRLSIGSTLGNFVIRAPLGAGGMGEVYDAEDTRLHRRVALKVLRQEVSADPVRRMRLEREASAVAMLNHQHIVTVYSLEEDKGILFITMELVEGATLAASLPPGGFPFDRALRVSTQLADALAAAHARGIVHRDLKPSNVMMTRDGNPKVLDFGLSRLTVDETGGKVSTDSLTIAGNLVGTAAYVSPEQIDGREADARSDLFSLGVLMFEMATGQRPFNGPSPLAVLTSIAKDAAPPASDLNPAVPEEFARLVDRCLVKDPSQRMQSAVDLRWQLEDLARTNPHPVRRRPPARQTAATRTKVAAGAGIAAVALMASAWFGAGGETVDDASDRRVVRLTVDLPKGQVIVPEFNPHIALSPDGTQLAFTPLPGPLSIRRLDTLESGVLEATKDPGFRGAPLFSPNSAALTFIQGNAIFSSARPFLKAALSGGAPLTLTEYDAFHRGAWASDGHIYWTARYPGGIVRISDRGGAIEPVTELDLSKGERSHRFAHLLPGEQALLYAAGFDGINSYDEARVAVWDFKSRSAKTLIVGGTSAMYSPSGHLVYARAGKLLAVAFDAARNEVTGPPVDVLDGVLTSGNTGAAEFSLSRRGDLAYVPGPATGGRRTLVWVDRSGTPETLPLPPASYLYPRLSPDGRYLAVEVEGPNHDLHIYDFARGVLTKVTTDGQSHDPVWAPDNKRIAFRSWISGGMTMWMMPADRSAKATRLDPSGTRQSPVSISPDGRYLAFDQKGAATSDDAWVLPLDGGAAQAVAQSRFDEGSPKFSPDGKWMAYASDESGRSEIYVQPFPGPGPKVQVSNSGGFDPVWQRSGPELYYRSEGKMMAVSVDTAAGIKLSAPRQLWEGNYSSGAASSCGMPGVTSSSYDVTADGRRFLMVRDDDAEIVSTKIVVVLNWAEELKAKMGRPRP
ncbi:MAG TPA: protein kinase [Vicinamibacterales bacterium]|nr:protein kinase [Vicinamibacterales bacterium]